MPEDAVMDAAVEAPLETSTEVEETGQQDTGLETPESQEVPQDGKISAPEPKLIDGGKLSADAKKHLDELKATNPGLAKSLQKALFKSAEIDRELPGGLKEVRELRQTIETLGGPSGVQEMQAEVNGFREFDQQYTQADPKAIEFMTSDPQGQEAFVKLMPAAFQKFEQLHPDGFSQYMAQVIGGTLGQHGIPLALERLADFIGDNPKAVEQWNKLAGFVKFIGDLSQKQVQAPKFGSGAPDTNGQQQFEQEKQAFEREKWKTATAGEQVQVYQSEWAKLAGTRQVSATQKAAIEELFESRLNRAIKNGHTEKLDRYFAAKDRDGFMRYASNLNKTEVPKALREAFDAVMPSRPGPKAGTAPAPKNGVAPKPGTASEGFMMIAKQPGSGEIDYNNQFNIPANFMSGKAILKGGKKVQWNRQQ
jgi:hypothetical protein